MGRMRCASWATLSSIILCVTRGQGELLYKCKSVFAYSVRVHRPLPVLAWPVRDCIGHNGHNLPAEEFFLWFHVGQPMCWCVQRAWSDSAPHTCTAAAKRCTLLYMSALQKSSSLCPHTLSSNSELMIFIPLGMLDKLSLSPLTKHILGRVSFTQLLTSVFVLNWKCTVVIPL